MSVAVSIHQQVVVRLIASAEELLRVAMLLMATLVYRSGEKELGVVKWGTARHLK